MIIHSFYSESHQCLFDNYFKPSIRDFGVRLIIDLIPQECSGVYMKDNWLKTMLKKLEFCEKLSLGNEIFVHSDCDVQFFKPIKEEVDRELAGFDLAFQHDGRGHYCAGLFCGRPSPRLAEFFEISKRLVEQNPHLNDQIAINAILNNQTHGLKVKYLSSAWWTHGAETFSVWDGCELNPPRDIIAHHANWAVGVDAKKALLEQVRIKINATSSMGS